MDVEKDRDQWTEEDERRPEGAEEPISIPRSPRRCGCRRRRARPRGMRGPVETVLNFRDEGGEEV
jgi:hypothetical protein